MKQKLPEQSNPGSLTYPNHDQDAKLQSGTSSILQSPKWGLKGHLCSLHLQNQDREPKFRAWVYQRPVTISESRSRCQPQSGTSRILQSPKSGLKGHGCSLHLQNKIEGRYWEHVCIRKLQYPNQDQDAKPQLGTSSIVQTTKWGLKGHGYSLHHQNQDRMPNFGKWVYNGWLYLNHYQDVEPQSGTFSILGSPKSALYRE